MLVSKDKAEKRKGALLGRRVERRKGQAAAARNVTTEKYFQPRQLSRESFTACAALS